MVMKCEEKSKLKSPAAMIKLIVNYLSITSYKLCLSSADSSLQCDGEKLCLFNLLATAR